MRIFKEKESNLQQRFLLDLAANAHPFEYTINDLKEKDYLLDWLAVNLLFGRPLKTKQQLLYGEPSTQKTLIFEMLGAVLNIYHASTRKNDFSGAHDHYDLWLFDEFHVAEDDNVGAGMNQATMAAANNTLLWVLDGQQCRLDAKYGRMLNKKKNVTVVTIMNSPVRSIREKGPFHERFMRLKFKSCIPHLCEERIIATLWGCIQRRLSQKGVQWENAKNIPIMYNEERACVKFFLEQEPRNPSGEIQKAIKPREDLERLLKIELGDA